MELLVRLFFFETTLSVELHGFPDRSLWRLLDLDLRSFLGPDAATSPSLPELPC